MTKRSLKSYRKVQGVLQSQHIAGPRNQTEEKKTKKKRQRTQDTHTNAREAYRPPLSFPNEVIIMPNRSEKKTKKKQKKKT